MNQAVLVNNRTLPVMESFYTLQGEGYYQGQAAYFIRLGGCDVGCVWCDVKESWDASVHPHQSIETLVQEACAATQLQSGNHPIVVITGGEPLMHDLAELTEALRQAGFRTHLETSGAHPLSGTWDWICVSPKKFKEPLPTVMEKANELKVVVFHKSDLEWAESWKPYLNPECKLYLQPEWDKSAVITPSMIEFVKTHPTWTLSLQIHKYINVP